MIYNINMSQSKKSVLGTLRRTAIHALGGEERKPRPAVTHARVDRIEPRIKPSRPYGPGSLPPSMIKPSFHHRRDRGGSGNRIQGLSDVAGSRQRDLRTRASNETSGIGQHLGKSTAHSQVIQAVNAETTNRARTDHGGTSFLSSMGGNPSKVNHRHPRSAISGTHQISPLDARGMIANDGINTLAKAVVA
jgi:hypothetical protein